VEKPKPEEAPGKLVNIGTYVLEPHVLKELFSSPTGQHVIPKLIEGGYWFDVGTPERYLEAVRFLLSLRDLQLLEASEKLPGVFL